MKKIKFKTIMIAITFILTVIGFVSDRYNTHITSAKEAKVQKMMDESLINPKSVLIKLNIDAQERLKNNDYPTRWF